jgi:hypothetical protein
MAIMAASFQKANSRVMCARALLIQGIIQPTQAPMAAWTM